MQSFVPLLALIHTLGAVVGTFFTTYAEIYYTRAARDGVIDHHERKYLRHVYRGLKWGMATVLVTGIAIIVIDYLAVGSAIDVLQGPFWAVIALTFFILLMSWLLARKQAVWWFASAALLSAWWMMLLIDLGFFNLFSFISIFFIYIIFLFLVAGKMALWRLWLWKPRNLK
jgi:hypothetical protein